MIYFILYFLLIQFTFSQEIEMKRFASYPTFEIDSSANDGTISVKVTANGDSIININNFDFYEGFSLKLVAQINNLYAPIDTYFPNINIKVTDKKLFLIQNSRRGLDSAKKTVKAFSTSMISVQTELQKIGNTLILVDELVYSNLESEIKEYRDVLELCGINTEIRITPRAETFDAKKVQETKAIIDNFKENVILENIIIIGRVPYAMSGHYTPDGHTDESFGAWPTDLYYGINSTNWTDNDSDTMDILFKEHKNLVGDGKFDQGYIPNDVRVNIGRIDMYNLPAFSLSEFDLIKRYLQKDIKFRKGEILPKNNAVFENGFEDVYQEKFPTEAMINYHALFGKGGYEEKKTRNIMDKEEYLFYWGAASGGTNNLYDVIYTDEIANQSFNGVFNTLFGSRAVEWTTEDNILRSVIASEPMALTCRWGVRPFFYTFPMGVGKSIGFCHTYSANNTLVMSNGSANMFRTVHQTLLGDPTLKMYYPKQVKNFKVDLVNNKFEFNWDNNSKAIAYNIYYKDEHNKKLNLINSNWIKTNSFEIENNFGKNIVFVIKQIEKVVNNQGYYFEESMGVEFKITTSVDRKKNFSVFPNPTSQYLNFQNNVNNIKILNLLGVEVYSTIYPSNKLYLINIGLKSGIYLVTYELNGKQYFEKIILSN